MSRKNGKRVLQAHKVVVRLHDERIELYFDKNLHGIRPSSSFQWLQLLEDLRLMGYVEFKVKDQRSKHWGA